MTLRILAVRPSATELYDACGEAQSGTGPCPTGRERAELFERRGGI